MRIGLALGSNLPPRKHFLGVARDALMELAGPQDDYRQAPLFQTDPVECPPGSGPFLNTALEMDFPDGWEPLALLAAFQEIERTLGRVRGPSVPPHGPRTIDIDFLYIVGRTFSHPELVLPHPRLAVRRFVLAPLVCIAPDRIPGGLERPVAALLAALPPADDPLTIVAKGW